MSNKNTFIEIMEIVHELSATGVEINVFYDTYNAYLVLEDKTKLPINTKSELIESKNVLLSRYYNETEDEYLYRIMLGKHYIEHIGIRINGNIEMELTPRINAAYKFKKEYIAEIFQRINVNELSIERVMNRKRKEVK